ncbi:hypothetical protein [Trichormus variabilis]|uniref:Uncharacterized protein n=1 Tax=Trichormus variabilis SAG 1403-4b TaxID=447716 RepID=A0A433UHT6_ANAVA|nr:hypothetical protein [Trichormus variabilis]MBD2626780.1 hypothetical protein [Trichormus variabilis FACHB-164]RUS93397.1 hypothetical protein DSM107003_44530 [Trichormus variabilis SAG 1403-4b]
MKARISWLVTSSCWLLISNSLNYPAFSKTLTPQDTRQGENEKTGFSCSEQSLETITTQLLRDLPSYANRTTQRARRLGRSVDIFPYILAAGKPEFQSLPLNPGIDAVKYESEGVEQVFFTTLERKYINKKAIELQQFHRLFLTKTKNGWNVVMMSTQTAAYPAKSTIAPARDSSNGAIAQGVKLWLRDCQAGTVRRR